MSKELRPAAGHESRVGPGEGAGEALTRHLQAVPSSRERMTSGRRLSQKGRPRRQDRYRELTVARASREACARNGRILWSGVCPQLTFLARRSRYHTCFEITEVRLSFLQ